MEPGITIRMALRDGHAIPTELANALKALPSAEAWIVPFSQQVFDLSNKIVNTTKLSRRQFIILCASFVGVTNPSKADLS